MTFRRIFPYFMTILAKHSLPNKTNPALPQESNRLRWRQSPHNPSRFLAAP